MLLKWLVLKFITWELWSAKCPSKELISNKPSVKLTKMLSMQEFIRGRVLMVQFELRDLGKFEKCIESVFCRTAISMLKSPQIAIKAPPLIMLFTANSRF